jgi:hypothetical protein
MDSQPRIPPADECGFAQTVFPSAVQLRTGKDCPGFIMPEGEGTQGWVSKTVGAAVFYRAAMTCWAIAVLYVYPIPVGNWAAAIYELFLRASGHSIFNIPLIQNWIVWPWYRWDSEWYIQIAADGYTKGVSTAYPPLYPLLIRLLGGLLGGNLLLSAVMISSVALGISCVLLYQEARLHFDIPVAARSVIYFLAFPTAFFLLGAYSESLFVMWVLLAWTLARRQLWPWALGAAILSVMTRYHGIGIFVPLAYLWWRSPKPRSRWGPALVLVPLIPLAWSFYLGYALHLDLPWLAQAQYLSQRVSWPWTGIIGNLQILLGARPYDTGRGAIGLDLVLTLAAIALLVKGIRDLPPEYTLFNVALILPALLKVNPDGLLVSMSRLVLVLWPNFILLGILGRNRIVHWLYLGAAIVLQAISSALFFLWFWVA